MWTRRSCNHTPKHHSPLSNQPHVVIAPARGLGRADSEQAAAAALNVHRQLAKAPFLDRTRGSHGTRTTRQCFTLHAAFVRAHPPHLPAALRRTFGRDEVDVGTIGPE